jgi:type VI secretion system ImpC/EvpB family protein
MARRAPANLFDAITTTAPVAVPEPVRPVSILDQLLNQPLGSSAAPVANRMAEFHAADNIGDALHAWFGERPPVADATAKDRLVIRLNDAVARIDDLLTDQLNAVLHQPELQKLEAGWRGLKYLTEQVPDGANIKVRVLHATWKDLTKDQERALEFDQSVLFRKVYSEEFDTPGGEPFGLLIGNYDVTHRPFPDHPTDDVSTLRGVAGVAAAAFAPFIAGVDPRLLELDSYADLDPTMDLSKTFGQADYLKWRSLRDGEDTRFLGLVVPKVLLREPYTDKGAHGHRFPFREATAAHDGREYLWGNGAFALGAVAIRAFAESAWLAEIRGTRTGVDSAGVVSGLPALDFGDGLGDTPRAVTDVSLTDRQEKDLSDLGLIPLCHLPGTDKAAFFTTPSVQKPRSYDEPTATANAKLSGMMQYMLCVSRIAHYMKAMIRDRIGSFTGPEDIQEDLRKWFMRYTIGNESATHEMKAKYPLREARVEVADVPGKPGAYRCSVHLRPHFQLDQLSAAIKLTTQLNTRAG